MRSASLKLGKCQERSFFRGGLRGMLESMKRKRVMRRVCMCVVRTVKENLFVCAYKEKTRVISPHTGPRTCVTAEQRSADLSR